jgi:hypothetical protein
MQAAHALTEDESQHHDQPERLRAFALYAALSRAWQKKGAAAIRSGMRWTVIPGSPTRVMSVAMKKYPQVDKLWSPVLAS